MRSAVCLALLLASAPPASAGGLLLPAHGVRTLERGGAFIAGADDADALFVNPAGLAHGTGDNKRSLLFDAAFVFDAVDHARIDNGGNALPPITNQQPGGQPLPALAGSLGIGDRLVIAGGLFSPYLGTHQYPDDGSQRYASIATTGTTYVVVSFGVAYKVSDRVRVGAAVQNVVSRISTKLVVDGCPGKTMCAPEDPVLDTPMTISQIDYLSPTALIGVQLDATPALTLGAAVQGPARVSATGKLAFELPQSAFFEGATVHGDAADVAYWLPPSVRAGVEWRPTPKLRAEVALDVELWSMHDEVSITPEGMQIDNVPGIGTLAVQPMVIPRQYKTTFAPSVGVEWHGPQFMIGAGYAYETAAADAAFVSADAIDSAKHVLGFGGGYEDDGWQIGIAGAVALLADVTVPLADAKVPLLQPLREQPVADVVNAGTYRSRTVVAGLRFARRW